MKVINIYGKEIEMDIGVSQHEISRAGCNIGYCFCDNKNGSISFFKYKSSDKIPFSECALFEKDSVKFPEKIKNNFSRLYSEVFNVTYIHKFGDYDATILKNLYGSAFAINFNKKAEINKYSISSIFDYVISSLLNQDIYYEDMDICSIDELNIKDIDSIKSSNKHCDYAYIQKVNDEKFVVRIFSPYDRELIEHSRIVIKKYGIYFLYKSLKGWKEKPIYELNLELFDFKIIGFDDLKKNKAGYCFNEDSRKFCLALLSPFLENFIKSGYDEIFNYLWNNFKKSQISTILRHLNNMLNLKDYCLGDIECKRVINSFSKFMDLSTNHLKLLNGNPKAIPMLNDLRKIFGEGFSSINLSTFEEILKYSAIINYKFNKESITYTIDKINRIYDTDCMVNVLKYFAEEMECKYYGIYSDYMQCIWIYDLDEYGFRWKLKMCDIGREHQRAIEVMNAIEASKDKDREDDFISKCKEYEKFSFSKYGYHVIIPTGIIDMVREGQALNHCVRSYIDKVADGETCILFIRKDNNINKPYFTLEIRDGSVRQCHGVNNCNPDSNLQWFLKQYCLEKKISMYENNKILAV